MSRICQAFVLFAVGCTQMNDAHVLPYGGDGSPSADGGSSSGATGLPCDIDAILQNNCRSCHSNPPTQSAPMAIVTLADLKAPAVTNHTISVAALSVMRMQNSALPMPPAPASPVSATDIMTFQSWMNAGTPMGSCTLPDGGGGDPYATPTVCTSNQTYKGGDGSRMAPGEACIDCHDSNFDAPRFTVAGTAYPSAHEPDDCYGISGMQIQIVDANGATHSLSTNSVGNFYSSLKIPLPYTAKIVANGKERVMSTAQMSGDCNSCHTVTGTMNAPGRIMAP